MQPQLRSTEQSKSRYCYCLRCFSWKNWCEAGSISLMWTARRQCTQPAGSCAVTQLHDTAPAGTVPFESKLTQHRERKAQERTNVAIDWRPRRSGDVACKWIGRAASLTRVDTTATTSTLECSLVPGCDTDLTQSPEVPHKQHSVTTKLSLVPWRGPGLTQGPEVPHKQQSVTTKLSLVLRCGPGLTQSPEVPHKQHSVTTQRHRKIRDLCVISGFCRKVD
jgi:hypothetical protein